jgi:hypothetical protein
MLKKRSPVTSAQIDYGNLCRWRGRPLQLFLHHGKENSSIRQLRIDEPACAGTPSHSPRNYSNCRTGT